VSFHLSKLAPQSGLGVLSVSFKQPPIGGRMQRRTGR
jgi:hypothetical protein